MASRLLLTSPSSSPGLTPVPFPSCSPPPAPENPTYCHATVPIKVLSPLLERISLSSKFAHVCSITTLIDRDLPIAGP